MTITPGARLPGLAEQIHSRHVDNGNGLIMHLLEAGDADSSKPCLLLLHGFPELAYSWRKIMVPLAQAGYRVIAPDQRGYGRTQMIGHASPIDYDMPLDSFRLLNLVRDQLGLLHALGIDQVQAVIGHDFGSPVAAWCALTRPDVFRRVVLMSAPFGGPPVFARTARASINAIDPDALLALERPRKHYQWYYSTEPANQDMVQCAQGLHDFLRAYYHYKSADWAGNKPVELAGWQASELARMPTYYIMDAADDMAGAVAPFMPTADQIANCHWLPDDELAVYVAEYQRTGFQGGLQWYRCGTGKEQACELLLYAGRTIDVPACFIGGASDWGVFQKPGEFAKMRHAACTQMTACHLVDGAGHWVQQEQPAVVAEHLLEFLA